MSTSLQGKRILIVDDEKLLREIISLELGFRGCQTTQAPCGNEAFELLSRQPFDAVVTDIRMPNGNGIELLEKIKNVHYKRPVVLLVSGYGDITEASAFQKGADSFSSKPFDLDTLVTSVERALMEEFAKWASGQQRIQTSLDVRLTLDAYCQEVQGKVLNLGRGGMFIRLAESIPPKDAKISFDIGFRSGKLTRIEGKGVVRWSRTIAAPGLPSGCGIEFLELSEASIRQILSIIDESRIKAFIPDAA